MANRDPRDAETFELHSDDFTGTKETNAVALWLYHRQGAERVELREGQSLSVGRSGADVSLPDRSLSRLHARFELRRRDVFVVDLGSTNGTWVNGERIEERRVDPTDEVRLGSVVVAVRIHRETDDALEGIDSYDELRRTLALDVARARGLGRAVALLAVRAAGPGAHVSRWYPRLAGVLRPFDRVGYYGPNEVLVCLTETDLSRARAVATGISELRQVNPLQVGLAVFPAHGKNVDELLEAGLRALNQAGGSAEVVEADAAAEVRTDHRSTLIAESRAMQDLMKTVDKVARSHLPVLIRGETGVGKEVLSRLLHERSPRRDGPLRSINCGAIPAHLIESVLFGHVKGAFTGADTDRAGIFEETSGGTVLLDEVGELSPAAQVALLRVLEEGRVMRVGSNAEEAVDVRILAATHRNLAKMVEEQRFRQDLLYRLDVVNLVVPALRERREDILPLAARFIERANEVNERQVEGLSPEAEERLVQHAWPGNIRELRNTIDRAVVISEGAVITVDDLPATVRARDGTPEAPRDVQESSDFKSKMKSYERRLILEALRECGGNITRAAEMLEIPYRTLSYKMRSLGISRED